MNKNEIPQTTIDGLNLARLYRVTIDPDTTDGYMRIAFIEADDEDQAHTKVAAVVALIDSINMRQASQLVCHVRAAPELVAEGASDDLLHRLFEIRGAAIYNHPIFLVSKPGTLTKKWAERLALRALA